jgi:multidrug transporter EmrE-like cation transporter
MKLLPLLLTPVFLLVASQLLTRWRMPALSEGTVGLSALRRLVIYMTDPYVMLAYALALTGSAAWLLVLEQFPVSLAFPLYISMTVLLVLLGGLVFFGESLSAMQAAGVALVTVGAVLICASAGA